MVVLFGQAQVRAQYEGQEFWWGTDRLQMHSSPKYLSLHVRSDTSWQDQQEAATQKGRAATAMYAPLLGSGRLSVRLKLQIMSTRIEPTMTYAMEVWSPPICGRQRTNAPYGPIDEVLHKARRLASIHASTHEHAWEWAASVKPAVLDSDCQALR